MNTWIIIWGIVILFSLVAFTYMSVKILYKGIGELKEMFQRLMEENGKNQAGHKH